MHGIWLYVLIGAVYLFGFYRGSYVRDRCNRGECPVPWCDNYKNKNKS